MEWNLKIFGFNFGTNNSITQVTPKEERSPIPPSNEDGAVTIQSAPHYGTYVDLEGSVRNEIELITRYREMSIQPELEAGIDEVVNEAITKDEDGDTFDLNLDDLKVSEQIKEKINDEMDSLCKLMNWNNIGDEIFRRWYIDGRIYYQAIVNEKAPNEGIVELRYIDPRKIRKIREIQKKKDPLTNVDIIEKVNEYYVYTERVSMSQTITTHQGVKIAPDSIIHISSNLMDSKGQTVLSYLHKAIKPLNNLRMIEDAVVIYRLSRSSERRVFYIDVGNMPRVKAEQYLYDIMMKYRNKLVYDANTGELRDDRKHLNLMEDFWIPRRGEGKSTEITTLQSGSNLSDIKDVEYFQKRLYRALGVPVSRLNLDGAAPSIVGVGRSAEVTREEMKFAKFIDRLRTRFQGIFLQALGIQLRLKNICNTEEWLKMKDDIKFRWLKSNNIDEMIEGELLRERMITLQQVDPYIGRFFSTEWVNKQILRFDDEEIAEMKAQMEEEIKAGFVAPLSPGEMMAQQQDLAQQQMDLQGQQMDMQGQAMDNQDQIQKAVIGQVKKGNVDLGGMLPGMDGTSFIKPMAGGMPGMPGAGGPPKPGQPKPGGGGQPPMGPQAPGKIPGMDMMGGMDKTGMNMTGSDKVAPKEKVSGSVGRFNKQRGKKRAKENTKPE